MAPLEDQLGTILYRLDASDLALRELRAHVDDRLDKLDASMARLAFVGRDVYESEKAAARDFANETRAIAVGARTVSTWALGLVVTVTFAAIVTALIRVLVA